MKIFDIMPQGEENALPGSEIDRLLGVARRLPVSWRKV